MHVVGIMVLRYVNCTTDMCTVLGILVLRYVDCGGRTLAAICRLWWTYSCFDM